MNFFRVTFIVIIFISIISLECDIIFSKNGFATSLSTQNLKQNHEIDNQKKLNTKLMVMEADEAFFDTERMETIAEGGVSVKFDRFSILSNKVLYNKKSDLLIAKGNVSVYDKEYNNFYYVDYVRIYKSNNRIELFSFKSSLINHKILATASKIDGTVGKKYKIKNLTFTTCKLCETNFIPNVPIWQIRACDVNINVSKDSIYYNDLFVDFWGKTILYLPYFSTPSFNSKFRTGFLFPGIYMGHQNYGFTLTTPYYINFSPSADLTMIPYFSTTKPIVLSVENRQVFKNGGYVIGGNITSMHNKDENGNKIYRGYITGRGNWTLSKQDLGKNDAYNKDKNVSDSNGVEFGFDGLLLFDKYKTYLKRYDYNNDYDILLSKFYFNTVDKNSFISLSTNVIQDLRDNAEHQNIVSLPRLRFIHRIPLYKLNNINDLGFVKFGGELYKLQSDKNADYIKAAFSSGSYIPFILDHGSIFEFRPSINLYGYDQNITHNLYKTEKDNSFYIIPELISTWRIPQIFFSDIDYNYNRKNNSKGNDSLKSFFIEPIVNMRISKNSSIYNSEVEQRFLLPNAKDIINPELNALLLDQSHSGNSLQYGLNGSIFFSSYNQIDFALGKSTKFYPSIQNKRYNGISIYHNGNNSNLMFFGALRSHNWSIENSIWYDEVSQQITRNTINLDYSSKVLQSNVGYTFTDYEYYDFDDLKYKQEVFLSSWYNFYENWWINFDIRRKLGNIKDNNTNNIQSKIRESIGIRYKNECLQVDFAIHKNYLKIFDINPSTSYSIRLGIPF